MAGIQEGFVHGVSDRSGDDLVRVMGAGGMSAIRVSRPRNDVLAYMASPREHCSDSQHEPLERVNREIKRHADFIGIFPNDAAILRLVGALMLKSNDE